MNSTGASRNLTVRICACKARRVPMESICTFFCNHRAVPERPHHYVKIEIVRACCLTDAETIETIVGGRLEMIASVPAGAYLVEGVGGERYAIPEEEFVRRYELESETELE
jgi:hypothetical protein